MKAVLNLQKMQSKNMTVPQIIHTLLISSGDFGNAENYLKEGMYSSGLDTLKGRCYYPLDT